jgi:hypothetical protein
MKKTIRKLLVRRETLRALGVLNSNDLARAIGGLAESVENCPAPQRESGKNCPAPVIAQLEPTSPP